MSDYKIETKCIQSGYEPGNGEPRIVPIYQSTTFRYTSSEQMGRLFDLEESGYFYTRLQNPTNDAVAAKICDLFLATLAERLKGRGIEVNVSNAAKDKLIEEGYDEVYGARPLKRVIQRRIEDALSEEILMNRVSNGQKVNIDVKDGAFTFTPAK